TLVVVTERLKPRARELFAEAVTRKLGWYGAELLAVREVARSADAVRAAYESAREQRARLILFAGASSIDPLDAAYAELVAAGGASRPTRRRSRSAASRAPRASRRCPARRGSRPPGPRAAPARRRGGGAGTGAGSRPRCATC